MIAPVIPFPHHRARPAIAPAEMRLRRALADTATDPDAGLNRQIRATQRLLDRPNLRADARAMWAGHLAHLRARAQANVRRAIGPEGGAA